MKRIIIERKEMTTYSVVLDVSDDEAENLLSGNNTEMLENLCRASEANWQDAEDPEFEVFEDNE